MRLFVALELPGPVKEHAAALTARLRATGADVKWVDPRSLHLTLKFVGEVEPGLATPLGQAVAEALAGRPPLELAVAGCGVFPGRGRPNVVWLGLSGQTDALAAMAQAVDEAVAALGLPREKRPFRPHLTIGRPRQGSDGAAGALLAAVAGLAQSQGPAFLAQAVTLMQSTLTPRGAIHKPVKAFTLGDHRAGTGDGHGRQGKRD